MKKTLSLIILQVIITTISGCYYPRSDLSENQKSIQKEVFCIRLDQKIKAQSYGYGGNFSKNITDPSIQSQYDLYDCSTVLKKLR